MEVVAKLFVDLESNNSQDAEEAKKKLTEIFSSTKETWLVHGMLDYFGQTYSNRIVDILVKVQAPHDKYIFDRLCDWVRSQNKILGLTLFGHIIRKHPTWLYKVSNHTLMKEVLKLLKTEKEIIPLMSALLCIIILLPIIPLYMGNFIHDLFEIFSYLAAWNCHNPTNLHEDQLIHLQFGLYTLFHRLYGMFPCNFIQFLKQEYIFRNDTAIFQHTIKPLLETVKMHPLLVSADKDSEINATRWKKMEPHDVVNECARFSLDYIDRQQENIGAECPCYMTPIKPLEYSSNLIDTQLRNNVNYFGKDFISLSSDHKVTNMASQNSYWTPSSVVQPTPPPTGTVPHTPTPTPNYTIPLISGSHLAADGSSPPEAAVEATPETTPLKDTVTARAFPVNSQAVRSIWNTSQPSSPVKKDALQFTYDSSAVVTSQKLLRMVSDRNHSVMQMSTSSNNNVPSSPLPLVTHLKMPYPKNNVEASNTPLPGTNNMVLSLESTQEDIEVNEINSQLRDIGDTNVKNQYIQQHPPTLTKECSVECEDLDQEEGSPCSAGGLHIPNSQSMIDFARRVNRMRMYSHCLGDTSSSYSAGTSPADVSIPGNYMRNSNINSLNGSNGMQLKHRRSMSWPNLKYKHVKTQYTTVTTTATTTSSSVMKTQTNKTNGSTSTSPSDEEAISAATHFRNQEAKQAANLKRDRLSMFQRIRRDLNASCKIIDIQTVAASTQTTEMWPQPYEHMFHSILQEEMRIKNSIDVFHQQELLQQQHPRLMPNIMLDQYIETCINKKQSTDTRKVEDIYRDHIQLLSLELQYEKHRRETHAERNRRLLGKSRAIRALEQNNETLKDQVSRLTGEISSLNTQLAHLRKRSNSDIQENVKESQQWKYKYQQESNENKQLRTTIENLQIRLADEIKLRKETTLNIEMARGELFDLRNEMQQTTYKAELGQQYREDLTKLQSEAIVMGEIQLKCKEKLSDLCNIKARDVEVLLIQQSYLEEVKDLKLSLEIKSSQLDTAKARLTELEVQLTKRDVMFTDQKRILKSVKEEYQEKFNALETKYKAQKAIVLRMEEHILELYKNLTAVNLAALSPDPDKTDLVGSLDHTSPLSLSLASSEGLSGTSASEIKNLQALVVQPPNNTNYNNTITSTSDSNLHSTTATSSSSLLSLAGPVPVGTKRQTQSDDIPVPAPGPSQQHYH